MISFSNGYKVPNFRGYGDGSSATTPTSATLTGTVLPPEGEPVPPAVGSPIIAIMPQPPLVPIVEEAVVWVGVPICAWILLTKGGLSSWLAGGLGAGLVYLRLNGLLSPSQDS